MTTSIQDLDPAALVERHAVVYASGQVPAFVHWKVAARLRAGRNPLTALDVADLASLGITHVLDLREECEWSGPDLFGSEAIEALARRGIERRNVPIQDYRVPRDADLAAAVAWIEEVLAGRQRRLYVHCRAGIQRSGTVLAAWRAWTSGEPFGVALWTVRRHGWPADPLPHQVDAAERWLAHRRAPENREK
jgi:rhodanese-related sulfurtransferase